MTSKIDGHWCTSIAVWQLPYANALQTANNVRAKMNELKQSFPQDIDYEIAYDTTPFIAESIKGVFHTLIEAIILVAIVVLVFLQNWRSTLIPLTAVPVAIIGTFAVMAAIGFSLNNLTLFGLVLAIGIVVDDAIVVVEAVEHHIEEGMRPKQAAYKAMEQVSGPVVAVALVLSAVFVPCAFISGITGQFFRQFALTIAVSTVISAFNSLTLSPALAALLLKPRQQGQYEALPRSLFVLAAGGLGYWAATSTALAPVLERWTAALSADRAAALQIAAPWAVAAVAGLTGWLLAAPLNYVLGWFFRLFNWSFRRTTGVYTRIVGLGLRGSVVVGLVYVGLLGLTWLTAARLPTGYIPVQDQSKLYAAVQLPDSASLERTQAVIDHLTDLVAHTRGVIHTLSVGGQSFSLGANGSNFGNLFITLDSFDNRHDPSLYSDVIAAAIRKKVAKEVPEAIVTILGPPPVSGLGSAGGFKFIVEDRSGDGDLKKLETETQNVIAAAKEGRFQVTDATLAALRHERGAGGAELPAEQQTPEAVTAKLMPLRGKMFESRKDFYAALAGVLGSDEMGYKDRIARQANVPSGIANILTVFRANSPQLYVALDRDQCQTMGVNPSDVFTTLQVYLGSLYVNDFNQFGRTWQVVVQAEGPFRRDVEAVKRLKVRNANGAMVPLGAVLTVHEIGGPLLLMRYNMYPAAAVVGGTRPGVSSGQGIDAMQRIADHTLSKGMGYEWTEINFIQIDASKNIWNNLIFPLAVVFVFLVLAAQYESWALPLAVILVVPMCILGSLVGVMISRGDVNIFTQVGFVVLVGLASKNAILIVEFAKHLRESGLSRRDATLGAVKLRLRPILMTSFAFILGVVPLMIAVGAGAEMRRALGVAVFAGMLGVTLFGIFLTPVFFYVIEGFVEIPLFHAERTRLVGRILLYTVGILTLGIPWLLIMLLGRLTRRRPEIAGLRLPEAVNGDGATAVNGHAPCVLANGNGNGHDQETTSPVSRDPEGSALPERSPSGRG